MYSLIESINPQNPYLEYDKFEEKLSPLWLQYVLCGDIENLLERFKQIMMWTIHYFDGSRISIRDYSSINYRIQVEDIISLRRSFKSIYPELNSYFDRKRNSIPKKLADNIDVTEDATLSEERYSKQDKCKHEHKTNIKDDDIGYYLKECDYCHKIWKIKKIKKSHQPNISPTHEYYKKSD